MSIEENLHALRQEVTALINAVSPYIGQDEMQARYGVCSKTLTAMERRGEIPFRVRGRWKRTDVMAYEACSTKSTRKLSNQGVPQR